MFISKIKGSLLSSARFFEKISSSTPHFRVWRKMHSSQEGWRVSVPSYAMTSQRRYAKERFTFTNSRYSMLMTGGMALSLGALFHGDRVSAESDDDRSLSISISLFAFGCITSTLLYRKMISPLRPCDEGDSKATDIHASQTAVAGRDVHQNQEIHHHHKSPVELENFYSTKSPLKAFVQRDEIFGLLKEHLVDTSAPSQVLLYGQSGMGKTEMAAYFATELEEKFSFVFWIDSATKESFEQDYKRLAEKIEIFKKEDSFQQMQKKVHDFLNNYSFKKPYLLIFDNVERPLDLPNTKGKVLVTSSSKGNVSASVPIAVESFKEEESLNCFKTVLSYHKTTQTTKDLIKALDYHPLLVSQVAHYIAHTPNVTEGKVLDILSIREGEKDFLSKLPNNARYSKSFYTIWSITEEALKKTSLALEWLGICSYLYPDSIPMDWVEEWLVSCGNNALDAGTILRALKNQGLIQEKEKEMSLSIHRIHQDILRETQSSQKENALDFLCTLADQFQVRELKRGEKREWELHASWFLEHFGTDCKEKNFKDKCKVSPSYFEREAFLSDKLGEIYERFSRQKAVQWYEHSLAILEAVCDSKDWRIALAYVRLGCAYDPYENNQQEKKRCCLEKFIKNFSNDRDVILKVVKQEWRALEYALHDLRNDKEVVLTAVEQNGWALQYASEELKNDKEVVLAAVEQNGWALQYASEELRNNREVVLAAVKERHWGGWALRYASEELRNDREVVLAAVGAAWGLLYSTCFERAEKRRGSGPSSRSGKGKFLQYASEELSNDEEVPP